MNSSPFLYDGPSRSIHRRCPHSHMPCAQTHVPIPAQFDENVDIEPIITSPDLCFSKLASIGLQLAILIPILQAITVELISYVSMCAREEM